MTLLLTLDAGSGDLVLPRGGTIPVVRETAKSTVQESIDWRDPKHMVLMKRYEGELAPFASNAASPYFACQIVPRWLHTSCPGTCL